MTSSNRARFSELSHDASISLLSRNDVGRLAYSFNDRVDIEPIAYVFEDDWVYGRTSPGAKLTTVKHSRWIAFEVDEIEDRLNWRSVVVHGALYLLDAVEDASRVEHARALEVIRSRDADALTASDSAPHRTQLFRIRADEITGRKGSAD